MRNPSSAAVGDGRKFRKVSFVPRTIRQQRIRSTRIHANLTCMTPPTMVHRLTAEFIGTFWLVLGGCGSAVFAAKFEASDGVSLGIGFLGVALAFGLTVLTGVYAFGTISGGHFNPAVTLGAALARRVNGKRCRATGSSR